MKITAKELEVIICNSEINHYLRSRIGSSLCNSLYDPANFEDDYPGQYIELYDAGFYNEPSDDDIFLCFEYISEVLCYDLRDFELELNLD